jgi:glutamyl-tRNA synthetase/glutamyl-Q tRNA(Asp) synthetase
VIDVIGETTRLPVNAIVFSDVSMQSVSAVAQSLRDRKAVGWRTRFAPAPTGWLHLGHAVNAVLVWGLARAAGGRVVLRVEDHDAGRCRPEFSAGILDDLDWLGLVPDEGHTADYRAGPALRQSARSAQYAAAMDTLAQRGLVYPCRCSRRDVAEAVAQMPRDDGELAYPGTCRHAALDATAIVARRLVLTHALQAFDDLFLGPQAQVPAAQCGDLLLRDRSGNWTYQFAVTVDDAAQHIDVVIRGQDLLASTGRQLQLAALLGRAAPPVYAHHALVLHADGSKLSKSTHATGLRELRAAGWTAAQVLGDAAYRAGLQPTTRSIAATDLAALVG